MAREDTTPEQLDELATQVVSVGAAIAELAAQLKKQNVPNVRLHLGTLTSILIPKLEHWFDVAELNAKEDVRSFLRGVESQSAVQKRYDENRKRRAAANAKPAQKRPSKN